MYKNYFKYTLSFIAIMMVSISFAQGPPPPPPPPPVLPIDGGIIGLLVLGVGYAVKKLREK